MAFSNGFESGTQGNLDDSHKFGRHQHVKNSCERENGEVERGQGWVMSWVM